MDDATPAVNGFAISNLIHLALLTEDLTYLDHAEQALKTFGQIMQQSPTACPSLVSALDHDANHTLIRTTPEQFKTLNAYFPSAVLQAISDLPPNAVGLVCQGLSCQEPAEDAAQLQSQIIQSQQRSLLPQ